MSLPKSWLRENGEIVPAGCGAAILDFLQQNGDGLTQKEIYDHLRQLHYTSKSTMAFSLHLLELGGFVKKLDSRYTVSPEGSEVKFPQNFEPIPEKKLVSRLEQREQHEKWLRSPGDVIRDIRGNEARIVRVLSTIAVVIKKESVI